MFRKLNVEITRFVDDNQPGFVECRLVDAWQREWLFIEKAPVVSLEHLDAESVYPSQGKIACWVLAARKVGAREIITIDTDKPWSISAVGGETMFEVSPEQLTADM